MIRSKITSIFISILCIYTGNAQTNIVLSPEAFIQQVRSHHPVAKQAVIITEKADADLLSARGGFDPVFEMNNSAKTLDGTNYYQYNSPELKLPTLAGIEIKTGYETSNGSYINTELTKGTASYIGVEIALLKGLLLDKRRAVLQQAKIYQKQSEQEQQLMINDLLFEAYNSYWEWAASYHLYKIYSNYVDVASKRCRLVSLSFAYGDRAMSDTIEAFSQLQYYQLLKSGAIQELNNSMYNLSQYLWAKDGKPYLLPVSYIPDTSSFEMFVPLGELDVLVNQVGTTHPLTKTYQYKLKILEVDRRLKLQNLLPVVNIKANVLSRDYYNYKGLNSAYFENNYKYGIHVKIPLAFRQARGEYKKAQLTIKDAGLQLSEKTWQLQNKISAYYNDARFLQEQVILALNMAQNYKLLLRNEELKFEQGESTLFLVNSRENKTLEIQQKLVELRKKYLKAAYSVAWASGVLK